MGMLPVCETDGCPQSSGHPGNCAPGVPSPGYERTYANVSAMLGHRRTITIPCGVSGCCADSNADHGLPFRCDAHKGDA